MCGPGSHRDAEQRDDQAGELVPQRRLAHLPRLPANQSKQPRVRGGRSRLLSPTNPLQCEGKLKHRTPPQGSTGHAYYM